MNKKKDKNYQRKELMLHKDIIAKFDLIADRQKVSTKKSMEDVLTSHVNQGATDERSVATKLDQGKES